MEIKIGKSHFQRKDLFAKGLRQGYLTVDEIEHALPDGSMTPAERWLLYFSLRAAEIEIRGQPPPEAQQEHPPEEHPPEPGEVHPPEG